MNSSLLTSDRVKHLKIGVTAVLATALVIVIGIYAKPPGAAHAPAVHAAASPTIVATVDRRLVSRFRSSTAFAAISERASESKGH